MNSLINYVFNSYANEVREPTAPIRFCLAIYMEDSRYSFLRHNHTGRKTVTSLESLGWESRGLCYGGLKK